MTTLTTCLIVVCAILAIIIYFQWSIRDRKPFEVPRITVDAKELIDSLNKVKSDAASCLGTERPEDIIKRLTNEKEGLIAKLHSLETKKPPIAGIESFYKVKKCSKAWSTGLEFLNYETLSKRQKRIREKAIEKYKDLVPKYDCECFCVDCGGHFNGAKNLNMYFLTPECPACSSFRVKPVPYVNTEYGGLSVEDTKVAMQVAASRIPTQIPDLKPSPESINA